MTGGRTKGECEKLCCSSERVILHQGGPLMIEFSYFFLELKKWNFEALDFRWHEGLDSQYTAVVTRDEAVNESRKQRQCSSSSQPGYSQQPTQSDTEDKFFGFCDNFTV
eukprot:scaffold2287_cov151-Cylindrotheca_fusiformis.AAC.4